MKNMIALLLVAFVAIGTMAYIFQDSITGDIVRRAPRRVVKPVVKQPKVITAPPKTTYVVEDTSNEYEYLSNRIDALQRQICAITDQLTLTPEITKIRQENNCY